MLTDYAEDTSIAMSEIHVWMKGLDCSIYEISVVYDFCLFELLHKLK